MWSGGRGGGGMYDAASLATMKFIVARNTVMYVLYTQLHTPRGVGMRPRVQKNAACGQALTPPFEPAKM